MSAQGGLGGDGKLGGAGCASGGPISVKGSDDGLHIAVAPDLAQAPLAHGRWIQQGHSPSIVSGLSGRDVDSAVEMVRTARCCG
jgi:hypothetical protein